MRATVVIRVKVARRDAKPPRVLFPHNAERDYRRRILYRMRPIGKWHKELVRECKSVFPARRDADSVVPTGRLTQMIGPIPVEFAQTWEHAEKDAADAFDNTNKHNAAQVGRQFETVIGVSPIVGDEYLTGAMNEFVEENVDLIESIPRQYHNNVQELVKHALIQGWNVDKLTRELDKRYSFKVAGRARLIARDQIGKLNGKLSELRQTDAGVTKYVWRTSNDERVRDTHRDNADKTFSWDDPPEGTGHPGQDYQCRCTAEPDFDSLIDDLEPVPVPVPEPEPEPELEPGWGDLQHNPADNYSAPHDPELETRVEELRRKHGIQMWNWKNSLSAKGPEGSPEKYSDDELFYLMDEIDDAMQDIRKRKKDFHFRSLRFVSGRKMWSNQRGVCGQASKQHGALEVDHEVSGNIAAWKLPKKDNGVRFTIRHELAHHVDFKYNYWHGHNMEQLMIERFGTKEKMNQWVLKNVGSYATTNGTELFAEMWAWYTSPGYDGRFPREAEKFLQDTIDIF